MKHIYQIFYQECGDDGDVKVYFGEFTVQEAAKIEEALTTLEERDVIQHAAISDLDDIEPISFHDVMEYLNNGIYAGTQIDAKVEGKQ